MFAKSYSALPTLVWALSLMVTLLKISPVSYGLVWWEISMGDVSWWGVFVGFRLIHWFHPVEYFLIKQKQHKWERTITLESHVLDINFHIIYDLICSYLHQHISLFMILVTGRVTSHTGQGSYPSTTSSSSSSST